MADPNLINDPAFQEELLSALTAAGELCFVVLRVQAGGAKDWYLVQDERELRTVLTAIPPVGPYGYSDRIEVFGTREFPYRTRDDDEWLRERAVKVLEETGEVVLACKHDDDPGLHDVDGADGVGTIDEWFSEEHSGERLVGGHPFRHPPDTPGVLVAWNPNEHGEVHPGAY